MSDKLYAIGTLSVLAIALGAVVISIIRSPGFKQWGKKDNEVHENQ